MDMSEKSPLFDDIALSGRFSAALGHQTSVQIDREGGTLFDDIHALVAFPECLGVADDLRPAVLGRDGVTSSSDDPGACQVTTEKECPSKPEAQLQATRRRTRSLPVSSWILPAPVIAKPVILSVRKAICGVGRSDEQLIRGLHGSSRGPPARRQRQSRHP